MSSQHYLILAEIEFWRDTLRSSKGCVTNVEYERMNQALILAQNKLIAYEMTTPQVSMLEGVSVAYH